MTISETAQKHLKIMLESDPDMVGLRVYVKGGGCHGYSYGMSLEPTVTDDDTIVDCDGVKLILDSQSAPMLVGSEVDYIDELMGGGFAIKNPGAKSTCGCGESFSL